MKFCKYSVVAAAVVFSVGAFAYTPGTFTASYPGIAGPVLVTVMFSKTKISKVEIGANKETVGIGQNAIKVVPGQITARESALVSGVSGATLTSNAILEGVKDCIQ